LMPVRHPRKQHIPIFAFCSPQVPTESRSYMADNQRTGALPRARRVWDLVWSNPPMLPATMPWFGVYTSANSLEEN
jgi:hypothetical protein